MIGAAIGAGLKIGSSIFGGIKMSQAMKKIKNNIREQQQENQDWFDRRYNEDSTQRADAQRLLTQAQETMRNRNRQTAGAQAMMGGTDESVAAQKAANNEALANTTSQIAATADARKDSIENQYMSTKANLNEKMNNITMQGAQQMKQAVEGAADAANSFLSADGLFKK